FRNGAWTQEGNQSSFTPSAADFGDQLKVAISYNGDSLTLSAGTVQENPHEDHAISGGNWKQAQTWAAGVPGATTDAVLETGFANGVNVNDTEFAHSLSAEGSGVVFKDNGTLIVSTAVTVLDGATFNLGGILEAGSLTGTITAIGNSTIEGANGANSWAEVITSAAISNASSTVNGYLAIDSGATLTLSGAGTHAENVKFNNNFADNGLYTGTLVIASGATFTGEIFNFHASGGLSDAVDFAGLQYSTGQMQVTASFSQATNITTVTVTNNALHQSVSVKLDGSYTSPQFALSQDSGTGPLLKDPPLDPGMVASASHDTFDFAFEADTAAATAGSPLAANTVIGHIDAISDGDHTSAFWLAAGSSPDLTLT